MKSLVIATSLLAYSAAFANDSSVEVGQIASYIDVKSAFVTVTPLESTSGIALERHEVYAVATFGNSCQVPLTEELVAGSQFGEDGRFKYSVAVTGSRPCPAVALPVDATIKVAELDREAGAAVDYTVNGVSANLAEGVFETAAVEVKKQGSLVFVDSVEVSLVKSTLPGGYSYAQYDVFAYATFSNACTAPKSSELVSAMNELNGERKFTLILLPEPRMCLTYYNPIQIKIKVGSTYVNDGEQPKVSVNDVAL